MGRRQPPSRSTMSRRSARTAAAVAGSCSGSTSSAMARSPARAWSASAPWPGAGGSSSGSSTTHGRVKLQATQARARQHDRFVLTLGQVFAGGSRRCRGSARSAGPAARARRNAARRALLVPTRAPSARSCRPRPSVVTSTSKRVLAHGNGRQGQLRRQNGRHVLQAVDGEVDLFVQQGKLEFFDENTRAPVWAGHVGRPGCDRRWSRWGQPRFPGRDGLRSAPRATSAVWARASALARVPMRITRVPTLHLGGRRPRPRARPARRSSARR